MDYRDHLHHHYQKFWGVDLVEHDADVNGAPELGILEFTPHHPGHDWAYATCGLGPASPEGHAVELFILSLGQDVSLIDLLAMVAHDHAAGAPLKVGDTVSFGRPWRAGSNCEYGLISLPYLEGPDLEHFKVGERAARCLWLLPITRAEHDYKLKHGLEALEQLFEDEGLDYSDRCRESAVA